MQRLHVRTQFALSRVLLDDPTSLASPAAASRPSDSFDHSTLPAASLPSASLHSRQLSGIATAAAASGPPWSVREEELEEQVRAVLAVQEKRYDAVAALRKHHDELHAWLVSPEGQKQLARELVIESPIAARLRLNAIALARRADLPPNAASGTITVTPAGHL